MITQAEYQRDYVRALIIHADIDKNGFAYSQAAKDKDLQECFRLLKNGFLAYSTLGELLKTFSKYTVGNESLSKKMKELRPKLDFMGHLRNKCTGHLDDILIDKAIQWEPSLFSKASLESEHHIYLVYKTLLESAINSYIDENGDQKYFHSEIDLFYPPNWDAFIKFMSDSETESLDFLDEIITTIKPHIVMIENKEDLFLQALIAGQTDFRLPKKGR